MSQATYAVALSGGVDSAVAAYLTKQKSPNTFAIFMSNWEDLSTGCTVEADLAMATTIANHLGIKLHVVSFAKEYQAEVFQEFLDDYAQGLTPNPDILCNKNIKFKYLLQAARALGADKLVTGHYANTCMHAGKAHIKAAKDPSKDQSYFLSALEHAQIAQAQFPLGDMHKTKVRQLAKAINLPNFDRKDSTGICFIEPKNFQTFLSGYILARPGKIITEHGQTIGEHKGVAFYTIGQRSGLNIGGIAHSSGEPWFVVEKCLATNQLIVAQGSNNPRLFKTKMRIASPNMSINAANLSVRIRHLGKQHACSLFGDIVTFTEPVRAITPGQYAAFYVADICLGSAKILEAL